MDQTPGGARVPVVDFHIHLDPRGPIAHFETRYARGVPAFTSHPQLGDADALLAFLDEVGIDVAVISSGPGMMGNLEQARAVNEALARLCGDRGPRLQFLAHYAPGHGEAALREVERWLPHAVGVAMPAAANGITVDDPVLDPLYALVAEQGKFLFIHPSLAPTQAEADLCDAYDLYRAVGREFGLVLATARLICGGVLDRHPRLKVVMSHLGGGIAAVLPRIRNYQDKAFWGVAGDPIHGRTAREPFEAYLSRIYFDTGGFFGDPSAVRIALEHIPPSQIVLGTDYPQEIRAAAPARQLVAELKRRGLLGNGAELLPSLLPWT